MGHNKGLVEGEDFVAIPINEELGFRILSEEYKRTEFVVKNIHLKENDDDEYLSALIDFNVVHSENSDPEALEKDEKFVKYMGSVVSQYLQDMLNNEEVKEDLDRYLEENDRNPSDNNY